MERDTPGLPLYVLAEKILCPGESLPANWALDGTTGYDYLNALNAIFVQSSNADAFDAIYSRFLGAPLDFHQETLRRKKAVLQASLKSEANALALRLNEVASRHRIARKFPPTQLREALEAITAALGVYRTYIDERTLAPSAQDTHFVERAAREAAQLNPALPEPLVTFLSRLLLLQNLSDFDAADRTAAVRFVMKWQQLSGPVMAKGVEDTTFYVYNRLLSLNEVGGHPDQFGASVHSFHDHNAATLRDWPHSQLATATHDTKRGEDVRARLNVLSEIPGEWDEALNRWAQLNAPLKTPAKGQPAPSPNDEYLLYQAILGAWPAGMDSAPARESFRTRLDAYMIKATREAKTHTSWHDVNAEYESALSRFIQGLFDTADGSPFWKDIAALQTRVAHFGRFNSLAQTLLKMTSPGVPDFYQGTELWELSLVDPDNRRPVDFDLRRRLLQSLDTLLNTTDSSGTQSQSQSKDPSSTPTPTPIAPKIPIPAVAIDNTGLAKLFLITRVLRYRRSHAALFESGDYRPWFAHGSKQDHLCAFSRTLGDKTILTVTPRCFVELLNSCESLPLGRAIWGDTRLLPPETTDASQTSHESQPSRESQGGGSIPGQWRNILTGESVTESMDSAKPGLAVADILGHFPVAFLERIND